MNIETAKNEAIDVGTHAGREAMMTAYRLCANAQAKSLTLAIACGFILHKIDGMKALGSPEQREAFAGMMEYTRGICNEAEKPLLDQIQNGPIEDVIAAMSPAQREALEGLFGRKFG